MNWKCPDCGKTFRNKNQWHSCYKLNIDDHLKNKDPVVQEAVKLVLNKINEFGNITLNPVKSVIQVKAGATFLSVKPKKDYIELEFQLGYEVKEFPVNRTVRISKNRVLHFITVDSPEDVDRQLIKWLHDSYVLVKNI